FGSARSMTNRRPTIKRNTSTAVAKRCRARRVTAPPCATKVAASGRHALGARSFAAKRRFHRLPRLDRLVVGVDLDVARADPRAMGDVALQLHAMGKPSR